MQSVTRVGIDLAKMFIQVHAVDAVGKVVCNKQLSRDKFIAWCNQLPAGCLVAMEACSGSHAWARKLIALGLDAKIIAANHVAPYRLEGKGGKNDANDAAAICEAAARLSISSHLKMESLFSGHLRYLQSDLLQLVLLATHDSK